MIYTGRVMGLVYDTNIIKADGYVKLGAEPLLGKGSAERYLRPCPTNIHFRKKVTQLLTCHYIMT